MGEALIDLMGTAAEAEEALADWTRKWRANRQPMIGTRKQIRALEAEEREIRFQLTGAALLWLWHRERLPEPPK